MLLLLTCIAWTLSAEAGGAGARESIMVDFETATVRELPAGDNLTVETDAAR
jgi:hypothetical protein